MLTSSPDQLKEPCVLITLSGEEEEYIHREEKFQTMTPKSYLLGNSSAYRLNYIFDPYDQAKVPTSEVKLHHLTAVVSS